MSLEVRVLGGIAEVSRTAWDALCDEEALPIGAWGLLRALEASGCAAPAAGWRPRHLTLWRDGRLCAAAPAYVKEDSAGDFSRDWGWAEAAMRARIRYYPKLVIAVPFTPATSHRVLAAPGEDRGACVAAIARAARELARAERLGAVQALYLREPEAALWAEAGYAGRALLQFHWRNAGYRDPADFAATLSSARRRKVRRERRAVAGRGIAVRTLRGEALAADPHAASDAFRFYRATTDRYLWGRPYLNEAFFRLTLQELAGRVELVEAVRDGRRIAGAFNLAGLARLFGRYWGCVEEHPFLHFEVALYHSIDECIRLGRAVFEAGAGGEHKLLRGFDPVPVHSAHWYADPRLHDAVAAAAARETRELCARIERWREDHAGRKR